MNKIKFNNLEMEVLDYNKNTYLTDHTVQSSASCSVISSDMSALNALMNTTITSIEIYHDDILIYDLKDINCKISNINEYLSDNHMNVSLSLIFDN